MKKIVALLMASAMAASLAACGGNTQNSEATSATPAESTAAESTACVAAVSLPCRYIHSPSCALRKEDLRETLALLRLLRDRLPAYGA